MEGREGERTEWIFRSFQLAQIKTNSQKEIFSVWSFHFQRVLQYESPKRQRCLSLFSTVSYRSVRCTCRRQEMSSCVVPTNKFPILSTSSLGWVAIILSKLEYLRFFILHFKNHFEGNLFVFINGNYFIFSVNILCKANIFVHLSLHD